MLARPPSCCRTAWNQLPKPSDTIWIPESALQYQFQRFLALSKTRKRHGSFVPGPLEARRRSGKRRMAHLSEAVPPGLNSLGSLWGCWGENDLTQWQWQAPKEPKTLRKTTIDSSSWELLNEVVPDLEREVKDDTASRWINSLRTKSLSKALMGCSQEGISRICKEYRQEFQRNVILGLVPEEQICEGLKSFSKSLKHASLDADRRYFECVSFYQAVWEGLQTCKVFSAADVHGRMMDILCRCLSRLPHSVEIQDLAYSIVQSASKVQFPHMSAGLCELLICWVEALHEVEAIKHSSSLMIQAEQALTNAESKAMEAHHLLEAMEDESCIGGGIATFEEALKHIKQAVVFGSIFLAQAGRDVVPLEAATTKLARLLECLPRETLSKVIYSSLQNHSRSVSESARPHAIYYWTSVLAKLRYRNGTPFRRLLTDMRHEMSGKHYLPTDTITNDRTTRSSLKNLDFVGDAFETSNTLVGNSDLDFGRLLIATGKQRECCRDEAYTLFGLLERLGCTSLIYGILRQLKTSKITISRQVLGLAIDITSKHDVLLALKLHRLYACMLPNDKQMQMARHPDFVISMIQHPRIGSRTVWEVVGIPRYERERKKVRRTFPEPIFPNMEILLARMSVAFARSEHDSPRVAFRNVQNCITHLKMHKKPLTPEITRALTNAGITRHINQKDHVSFDRIRWATSLIEDVEGTEVAEMTYDIATFKNGIFHKKIQRAKDREYRERNVLGVGPID